MHNAPHQTAALFGDNSPRRAIVYAEKISAAKSVLSTFDTLRLDSVFVYNFLTIRIGNTSRLILHSNHAAEVSIRICRRISESDTQIISNCAKHTFHWNASQTKSVLSAPFCRIQRHFLHIVITNRTLSVSGMKPKLLHRDKTDSPIIFTACFVKIQICPFQYGKCIELRD